MKFKGKEDASRISFSYREREPSAGSFFKFR
jgi:hypothetical protein